VAYDIDDYKKVLEYCKIGIIGLEAAKALPYYNILTPNEKGSIDLLYMTRELINEKLGGL